MAAPTTTDVPVSTTPVVATPAVAPAAVPPAPLNNNSSSEGKWTTGILDIGDDPVGAIIGYCLPCVLYGQTAERVHGGDMVNHCLKFWLYSCVCACGLVAGPTRQGIRDTYKLPVQPGFLKEQAQADCITYTVPCVNCFALCQDAREVTNRNPAAAITPLEFTWGIPPTTGAPAAAASVTTTAPDAVEMAK